MKRRHKDVVEPTTVSALTTHTTARRVAGCTNCHSEHHSVLNCDFVRIPPGALQVGKGPTPGFDPFAQPGRAFAAR